MILEDLRSAKYINITEIVVSGFHCDFDYSVFVTILG